MIVLFVICTILVVAAGFGLLLRRQSTPAVLSQDFTAGNVSDRYRPMARLLDDEDFEILNAAGDRRLLNRVRRQRRTIFRGYLRSLRRDHSMLCSAVRCLMVNAATDRQDLAVALIKIEWAFRFVLAGVYVRLAAHAVGLGTVDVRALVGSIDQVAKQLELLRAAASPAMTAAAA